MALHAPGKCRFELGSETGWGTRVPHPQPIRSAVHTPLSLIHPAVTRSPREAGRLSVRTQAPWLWSCSRGSRSSRIKMSPAWGQCEVGRYFCHPRLSLHELNCIIINLRPVIRTVWRLEDRGALHWTAGAPKQCLNTDNLRITGLVTELVREYAIEGLPCLILRNSRTLYK